MTCKQNSPDSPAPTLHDTSHKTRRLSLRSTHTLASSHTLIVLFSAQLTNEPGDVFGLLTFLHSHLLFAKSVEFADERLSVKKVSRHTKEKFRWRIRHRCARQHSLATTQAIV